MNTLKKLLSKIVSFFTSGKAEAAFNAAVALVPKAIPIVQTIASLTPNRTDDEITVAFAHYAVPFKWPGSVRANCHDRRLTGVIPQRTAGGLKLPRSGLNRPICARSSAVAR